MFSLCMEFVCNTDSLNLKWPLVWWLKLHLLKKKAFHPCLWKHVDQLQHIMFNSWSLKPPILDFSDNVSACTFWWLLDLNMSLSLGRLFLRFVTDLQPCSFSSSSHADSSSLHSSDWEQLGGSHVTETLMCMSRERLTLPIESSVIIMSIFLMYQLDLFMVLSNEPETNGLVWRKTLCSVAYLSITFPTRYAVMCSYFISFMAVGLKLKWYQNLELNFFSFWKTDTLAVKMVLIFL